MYRSLFQMNFRFSERSFKNHIVYYKLHLVMKYSNNNNSNLSC